MALELIIQEIKALGDLKVRHLAPGEDGQPEVQEQRRFRVRIGEEQFISKECGHFASSHQLYFHEPFSYAYDHRSHLLHLEIFKQHDYLDNSDLHQVLTAQVDLADLTILHGDLVESPLYDWEAREVGKVVLAIETFRQAQGYLEKVSSKVFFEAVKEQREQQVAATEAAKNIKTLMVSNSLADTFMTISSMTMLCEKEDPEIFMREGFLMVRYGPAVWAFSSLLRIASKENAHWADYLEFLKNEGVKFEFFFFHYDELGSLTCKARGEIKYVVFDETINLHSISLLDKRSAKYGVLMVKFSEKQVDKAKASNKLDKRLQGVEPVAQEQIEVFNRYRFESKFNNHVLSEKMWALEQLEQAREEEKQRPSNPEEKKQLEEHSRFISFLQKEMIKIERELAKREHLDKKDDRKTLFLPTIDKPRAQEGPAPKTLPSPRKMSSSVSAQQFASTRLPRI
jgi:hypothetical protein